MKSATQYSTIPGPDLGQQFVVKNDRLQSVQRRFALITIVVPFLGTIAALLLWTSRPPAIADLGLLAIMYVLTSLGITVGFHRHFSHRAFQARPALRAALGISRPISYGIP
jgi:stearoyl-CoA desaturase (delta-9 desaturase)